MQKTAAQYHVWFAYNRSLKFYYLFKTKYCLLHCLQHSHCLLSSATCVRATVNGQRTRPGCPGNTHLPTATCCSPLWQHFCPVTTRTETTWRTSSNLVGCVRSTVAATHRHTPSHPHADRPPSCARPERAQPVSRARGPRVERESQPERIVVLRLRLCLPRLHFVCSSPLFGSPQHCCWARACLGCLALWVRCRCRCFRRYDAASRCRRWLLHWRFSSIWSVCVCVTFCSDIDSDSDSDSV